MGIPVSALKLSVFTTLANIAGIGETNNCVRLYTANPSDAHLR
jgi:hypothetical protein